MFKRVTVSFLFIFISYMSAWAIHPYGQSPAAPADNVPRITVEELKTKMDSNDKVLVVDVRKFFSTKIKGAIHIPMEELQARMKELPKDKLIVTTCSCSNEASSSRAAAILKEKGYNAAALKGGQRAWEEAKYPTEQVNLASQ